VRLPTLAERERLQRRCRDEVARHYGRPLTVTGLAHALGTSPRQLQRTYAQAGETSFAEDLRRARLSAAAELLAAQPIAVGDVGRLVGYPQGAHFARAFRQRYGMSPAAFRRAARAARECGAGRGPDRPAAAICGWQPAP